MSPGIRAFESLYDQICGRYDREQIGPLVAALLRQLIPRSSAPTPAELERLLAVLDESDGALARSLYTEWDEAYLQLSDEHDGDSSAHPEIYRGFETSRLAAAVAGFKSRDCRERRNFTSVMYELAAGLDWNDDVLISAVQSELALT
jgi:hypothetical protein